MVPAGSIPAQIYSDLLAEIMQTLKYSANEAGLTAVEESVVKDDANKQMVKCY